METLKSFPPNDTVTYIGKMRFPSKNEHYYNKTAPTANPSDSEKYKKKNILRNKSIKMPKQNLLVMKWEPPIKINFD